jgi:hypothetical protein
MIRHRVSSIMRLWREELLLPGPLTGRLSFASTGRVLRTVILATSAILHMVLQVCKGIFGFLFGFNIHQILKNVFVAKSSQYFGVMDYIACNYAR